MSYWNLIYHYGVERFARNFENAGGASLITRISFQTRQVNGSKLRTVMDLTESSSCPRTPPTAV